MRAGRTLRALAVGGGSVTIVERLRAACCKESPINVEAHVQRILAVVLKAKKQAA